jgi:hypothetical protein
MFLNGDKKVRAFSVNEGFGAPLGGLCGLASSKVGIAHRVKLASTESASEIKLAFTGLPKPVGGAPQSECEESDDERGGGGHQIVLVVDPLSSDTDGTVRETLSKAATFFGILLGFFLLFLLTRSKR